MMTSEKTETIISKVLQHHIDFDKAYIFLFGSRASGRAALTSDYDMGVYMGKKIPLGTLAKIRDELEDYPIPVDVDIVDFSMVSRDFKQMVLQDIKVWNRPRKDLKLI